MIEYIDLKIDFTNRNAVGGITLDRVTTRNYDTAIRFRIEIIGHALDDTYDVKILTKYHKSGLSVMTTLGDRLEIVDGKLIYTPKVNLITEADRVRNYLYLSKDGLGLDMAQFNYQVDVSQIGEITLDIRQAYDESYETLITEFEQALEDYKLTLPQADSVRAEVDVILNQFGVDSQAKLNQYDADAQQVIADNQTAFGVAESNRQSTYEQAEGSRNQASEQAVVDWNLTADALLETVESNESSRVDAEATRKSNETTRISNENARKSAEDTRQANELLREENYIQKVDTAIVEADVVAKVDNKVTELAPQINNLTAQLAQKMTKNRGQVEESDLSQGVREIINGDRPLPIAEVNSILEENIVDGQVSKDKTDFLVSGRNLFNKDKATIGQYVSDANGQLFANDNRATSDFIRIEPNTEYSFTDSFHHAFYDRDKKFISGGNEVTTVESPSEAYYLRKTLLKIRIDTYMITQGSNVGIYEEYYEELKQQPRHPEALEVRVSGKNILDTKERDDYYVLGNDGMLSSTPYEWFTTKYLLVKPNTTYTTTNVRYIYEYNKAMGGLSNRRINIDEGTSLSFTTGANTFFIKATARMKNEGLAQIEEGEVATEVEPVKYALYSYGQKLFDLSNDQGSGETVSKDLVELASYKKMIDSEKYQVYLPKDTSNAVSGILRNIAVKHSGKTYGSTIGISTDGINGGYKHSVVFNDTNFPGLKENSKFRDILVMPWTRQPSSYLNAYEWRMVVITEQGQMFHNFPSRGKGKNDGVEVLGDIVRFEESVVWDLPERKYPTKNPNPKPHEYYFPVLPDEKYEISPKPNTDASFSDAYGNGGFGESLEVDGYTYPRFYQPNNLSFAFMGGAETTKKYSLIGTYASNINKGDGTRTGVFTTMDGGRNWFLKYEFSDSVAGNRLNWGNAINSNNISNDYVEDSFTLKKKNNVVPEGSKTTPSTKFYYGEKITIKSIVNGNPTEITTSTNHNLRSGDVIVIEGPTETNWSWMVNNSTTNTDHGNGVFFKVEVTGSTTLKLHEYVHSWSNPLPARHIHGINALKDGFTISTGEAYPDSWLLYVPVHHADSYDPEWLGNKPLEFIRLNSSSTGLVRPIGFIIQDNPDQTVLFASDNSLSERGEEPITDGRTITRNSIGLFKGKLSDIDDFSKFYPILEQKEPSYYFKEYNGILIHGGQRGEFAISFDGGVSWSHKDILSPIRYPSGYNNDFIVASGIIIALKQ